MGWPQLAGVGARWRDAAAEISRFLAGVGVRWRELVPRGHSFGHSQRSEPAKVNPATYCLTRPRYVSSQLNVSLTRSTYGVECVPGYMRKSLCSAAVPKSPYIGFCAVSTGKM